MAIVVLGIAVLPVTAACADTNGDGEPDVVPLPSASLDLPTELPTTFPTQLGDSNDAIQVGEPVELTGTVVEDGMFVLEVRPDGDQEQDVVPVITTASANVGTGDQVTVNGRWVRFDAATFEDEIGLDLDDDFVERYSGQQAVVATSVTK
jgi:hypothetical protein